MSAPTQKKDNFKGFKVPIHFSYFNQKCGGRFQFVSGPFLILLLSTDTPIPNYIASTTVPMSHQSPFSFWMAEAIDFWLNIFQYCLIVICLCVLHCLWLKVQQLCRSCQLYILCYSCLQLIKIITLKVKNDSNSMRKTRVEDRLEWMVNLCS